MRSSSISTQEFGRNFKLSLNMMTEEQLRLDTPPNTWETVWIMWNYVDKWHHYYFTLKANGSELGKKDNVLQREEQTFLANSPFWKVKMGQWQHIDITVVENHFTVGVDGLRVVDVVDRA